MSLQQHRTIIIPRWIYQAFVRHHIDMTQILNPEVVSKVLSRDDLAEWIYVNDEYQVARHHMSNTVLRSIFPDVVNGMGYIKDRVVSRLSKNENSVIQGEYKCYETINVNDLVLVILDEEFERILTDTESLLDFVRQYLKAHCRVMPIAEVSYLPLHALYIELL